MRPRLTQIRRLAAIGLALGSVGPIRADDKNIHYLAEHVPESAMDADYAALPWPGVGLDERGWQSVVDIGVAHTRTEFIDLDGSLVAFAAAHGVRAGFGYELLGFYDRFSISDGNGRAPLSTNGVAGVPIDLEQLADFSGGHGAVRRYGAGGAAIFSRVDADRSSQLIVGALLERFDVVDFGLAYRVVGGIDAGATGTVGFNSRSTFITPFVAWQRTRQISKSWSWSPRAMFMQPLPAGDLETRITGPGFDLASPLAGGGSPIGDAFVVLGLAFEHRPSGIEIDLGGMLFFALAGERLSHPGVDNARVVHIAWRHRPRARN